MDGARAFWIQKAGEKLSSSRRDYINGIQEVVFSGKNVASISLVGQLPLMVEHGMAPFDMHATLLGPNVPVAPFGQKGKRVNQNGRFYRSIPFRHQSPGTLGQGGGAPMGSDYAGHDAVADAAALGKQVYAAAKKLSPTLSSPGGPTQWGGRLPAGMAPKLKPHHTTDIYAGMVRQQKTYVDATQNQYTTFRTISEEQPHKWLHPGIQAANISDEVAHHLEQIAPAAFLAAFEALT